jgi:hypothetical protein
VSRQLDLDDAASVSELAMHQLAFMRDRLGELEAALRSAHAELTDHGHDELPECKLKFWKWLKWRWSVYYCHTCYGYYGAPHEHGW